MIDGDTVEEHNLPRQLLYGPADAGRAKVHAAATAMRSRSHGDVLTHFEFLSALNARALLQGSAVVADCTDDLFARELIATTCAPLGIPVVSGAVHGHQIQVHTRPAHPTGRPSPIFKGRPSEEQVGCDMQRIPASVIAIAAALMSQRIVDLLSGGNGLAGVLDLVDTEHGRWMRLMGADAGEIMDTPVQRTFTA